MIKNGVFAVIYVTTLAFYAQDVMADGKEKFADKLYESARLYHQGIEKADINLLLKAAERRQQAGAFYVKNIAHTNFWWSADHILHRASQQHPGGKIKVAAITADTDRGSFTGGYALKKINVPAKGKVTLTEKFKSHQIAVIYGEGQPGSELDMQVSSHIEGELPLCEDVTPGGYMLCKFTPDSNMPVNITVINQSAEEAELILLTN
ncbi:hypothetical protein [Paremcibacter congregatus]|uniref:hypothetical protein n=1 Tax=Paremcibacter congregatus TaxID=2043170 RepID=UPI0030EF0FA6|tara:strand:+ start:17896 stop:18516 length:621 start_codon:yes stop_codon:yes gene_type:complete